MGEDRPHVTIAEEMRGYAEARYPGVPAASPDAPGNDEEVDERERGDLLARRYEHTPTSTIDSSIATAFGEMACARIHGNR